MKRPIADALYWLVFPRNKVARYSWPLWYALPHRLVRWISANYSPEPQP